MELMKLKEAAEYIGIENKELADLCREDRGPEFQRSNGSRAMGGHAGQMLFDPEDLVVWADFNQKYCNRKAKAERAHDEFWNYCY